MLAEYTDSASRRPILWPLRHRVYLNGDHLFQEYRRFMNPLNYGPLAAVEAIRRPPNVVYAFQSRVGVESTHYFMAVLSMPSLIGNLEQAIVLRYATALELGYINSTASFISLMRLWAPNHHNYVLIGDGRTYYRATMTYSSAIIAQLWDIHITTPRVCLHFRDTIGELLLKRRFREVVDAMERDPNLCIWTLDEIRMMGDSSSRRGQGRSRDRLIITIGTHFSDFIHGVLKDMTLVGGYRRFPSFVRTIIVEGICHQYFLRLDVGLRQIHNDYRLLEESGALDYSEAIRGHFQTLLHRSVEAYRAWNPSPD